jgi:hypothetical protein
MIKREFERFRSSITIRAVTDGFCFIVESFYCPIVNWDLEIV